MFCCDVVHDGDSNGMGGSEISDGRYHVKGEDGIGRKYRLMIVMKETVVTNKRKMDFFIFFGVT